MASIADDWARRKRRTAAMVVVATLVLTYGAYLLAGRPTVRKLQSRSWPRVPARVELVQQVYESSAAASLLTGKKVGVTFSYALPNGQPGKAKQEVSIGFARSLGYGDAGYLVYGRQPARLECARSPDDPSIAVLETGLTRGDLWAVLPLVVALFGGLVTAAEWRAGRVSEDPHARAAARNAAQWEVFAAPGTLTASPKPPYDATSILFSAMVAMPIARVRVGPHPLVSGQVANVWLEPLAKGARGRRLRVRLMVGVFNGSGRTRHARWVGDVFDGRLPGDELIVSSLRLPRQEERPISANDAWLRLDWRTRFGLRWSRTLWLSLDDHGTEKQDRTDRW